MRRMYVTYNPRPTIQNPLLDAFLLAWFAPPMAAALWWLETFGRGRE